MKKLKGIIRNLLVLAVIAAVAGAVHIGNNVFRGSMLSINASKANHDKSKKFVAKQGFDMDAFKDKYHVGKISVHSSLYSHWTPASYITVDGDKNRDTVIMIHDLGDTRVSLFPQAEMFLENGYNVVSFDQRASGGSTCKFATFGAWEKQDLADCVAHIRNKIDPDKKIILYGVGMGAETIGVYLGMDGANEDVNGAILDSPYSSVRDYMSQKIKGTDTKTSPSFMLFCGSIITSIRLSITYGDTDVPEHIKNTKVPVLLCASEGDKVAPASMSQKIYDAIKGDKKQMFKVSDSGHKRIFYEHRDDYEKNVMGFAAGV